MKNMFSIHFQSTKFNAHQWSKNQHYESSTLPKTMCSFSYFCLAVVFSLRWWWWGQGGRFWAVYCPNIWRIKYIPISSEFGSCWNGITQYSLKIRVVYMWVLKSLLRNSDMIFWMFYSILLRITELNKLVSQHSCEFYLLSMQNNSLYHGNCICLALYIFSLILILSLLFSALTFFPLSFMWSFDK